MQPDGRNDTLAVNEAPSGHRRDPFKVLIASTCVVILALLAWEIAVTAIFESPMAERIENERRSDRIKEGFDLSFAMTDRELEIKHAMRTGSNFPGPINRSKLFKAWSEDQIEREIRANGVPWSLFR